MSDWDTSRQIARRMVVQGQLILTTPAHFGNGERGEQVDLPLLLDPIDNVPLLVGTSIAGALRAYLQARQNGFFKAEQQAKEREASAQQKRQASDERKRASDAVRLFGGTKGDEYGDQSPLIVDDALGMLPAEGVEIRDGVRIDVAKRTAEDKFKYDIELLPAGTTFDLRFELLISANEDEAKLKQALALALQGLEDGAIALGARKSRGFGRCEVREWKVTTYNLRDSRELLAWLAADHANWVQALPDDAIRSGSIAEALIAPSADPSNQNIFTITAEFALASPLLIRSEEPLGEGDNQPDFVHIRNGKHEPILPGTSLAGALRARASRILNTIKPGITQRMIDCLFGKDMQRDPLNPTASRLITEEVPITGGKMLVQNRVAIDRFTGGALDTALFDEAPQVGGDVALKLTIREHPKLTSAQRDAEKGLLLLLLKDLWTGDLPIGGTSSIGRGRLRGINATIEEHVDGKIRSWQISEAAQKLSVSDEARALFEGYVAALNRLESETYA